MDELAPPNIGNHGRCGYEARVARCHGYILILTQAPRSTAWAFW